MNRLRVGIVCLLMWNGAATTVIPAAPLPEPSSPSMPGTQSRPLASRPVELRLTEAISLGLRDNRTIHSAYLQRIAQQFELRIAEDRFTPKLQLSSRALLARSQEDSSRTLEAIPATTLATELGTRFSLAWTSRLDRADSRGRFDSSGFGFSVTQPLLRDAGREVNAASVELARLGEQINRLNLKNTVCQTVTQIIRAYREVVRAQEQVRIAGEALGRSRQLLAINRALIAAGRMAEFEILQAEADVASQELGLEETANQLEASRRELLRLLALDLDTPLRADDDLQVRHLPIDVAQARRIALENQPEYLVQLLTGKQAKINLKVAQNSGLPDVSLAGGGNYSRNDFLGSGDSSLDRRWDWYGGVQVDIPIGDLSRQQNEVRAEVDTRAQVLRQADARQALEQSVGDAVRDTEARWRQYQIALRGRDLSQKKLEFERSKFKVGRSSNFQVLSFESDLRNAENTVLNVLLAYLNAQTQLDLLLGMTLESWHIELND